MEEGRVQYRSLWQEFMMCGGEKTKRNPRPDRSGTWREGGRRGSTPTGAELCWRKLVEKDRTGEGRGWVVSRGCLCRAVKARGGILGFVLRVGVGTAGLS